MNILKRQAVLDWLTVHVPQKRMNHILRVEEMAETLASHHHENRCQAQQAGLLHDLAKFFPPSKLLSMAEENQVEVHPIERHHPYLLHAPVSAIIAQQNFGVTDPLILDAIRHHTLGAAPMSPLSCIVFLADSLEPGRGDSKALNELRALSQKNLWRAVERTCDFTLKKLIKKHQPIHPQMIATRNWALQQAKQKSDKL